MGQEKEFVPALRFPQLTRFYDTVVRWTTREEEFRSALVEMAAVQPGDRVLDLGCGSGSNATLLKRRTPGAQVAGVDADGAILALARRKAAAAGVQIEFQQAMASVLPYPDGAFDKVVSSLFFHHLRHAEKLAVFRECLRVLRAGGELFIADWGRPGTLAARVGFFAVRLLDGFDVTRDHARGRLPELMEAAGCRRVTLKGGIDVPAGTIVLLSAERAHAPGDE